MGANVAAASSYKNVFRVNAVIASAHLCVWSVGNLDSANEDEVCGCGCSGANESLGEIE
jgi:hypothetical protein